MEESHHAQNENSLSPVAQRSEASAAELEQASAQGLRGCAQRCNVKTVEIHQEEQIRRRNKMFKVL